MIIRFDHVIVNLKIEYASSEHPANLMKAYLCIKNKARKTHRCETSTHIFRKVSCIFSYDFCAIRVFMICAMILNLLITSKTSKCGKNRKGVEEEEEDKT